MAPKNIFISYSHLDEKVKDRLTKELIPLTSSQLINVWEDRQIQAGQQWDDEIAHHLCQADFAILLISPDFLNSKYINEFELPEIIKRVDNNQLNVIPIIIRECNFAERTDITRFQALPKDARPLTLWLNKEEVWHQIRSKIEQVILRKNGISSVEYSSVYKQPASKKFVVLYDIEDKENWKLLKKHLFVLTLTNSVEFFDIHEDIKSGDVDELVNSAIASADYLLCFITPNFWPSCYFWVHPFLTSGKTHLVIPLKIKNTAAYRNTPFNQLRSYPSDNRFVFEWDNPENGLVDISNGIQNLL